MNIGERIKKLRKEKGLSVDYIAEKLGKNRATVYRYESSEIENLPYTILVPLADILGTTPMYLMGCEVEDIKVTKEEKQLLENYNKLNSKGKEKLIDYSDDLTTNIKYMDNSNDEITATKANVINTDNNKEDDEFTKVLEARRKAEQYFKENPHLMPIASHDKEGDFTEEDYKHDDDIMTNDDLWK